MKKGGRGSRLPWFSWAKKSDISCVSALPWTPAERLPNFPDMPAAITSWFWLLSVPRGAAVIPDHVGIPGSQCHPPTLTRGTEQGWAPLSLAGNGGLSCPFSSLGGEDVLRPLAACPGQTP